MITYLKKDLKTITHGIIVHGCNCQGVMGSGVAKALRGKWPDIFPPYREKCDEFANRRQELLGTVVSVLVINASIDKLVVVNAFTQLTYGRSKKVYADVNAIETALTYCAYVAKETELPLYLPPIGCGFGGLNFETDVEPIVELVSTLYPTVDISVCDL